MAKLTPTQLKWKAHVDAAKAAGQSLTHYAGEHTLNLQTLYSHSRKVNKPGKSSVNLVPSIFWGSFKPWVVNALTRIVDLEPDG